MDTIKFNRKNVQVVAHRGLCGIEPENTVSAFIAAGNRSYFGIECDVHVTKDGKFVVIHDSATGRVSATDINVEESTFEEVRKVLLDNISRTERVELGDDVHFSDRSDLVIPEMHEYIKVCKKYGKKCVLEIKNKMEPHYIEKMIEEIRKLDYLENVIFIGANIENLIEVRRILPEQKIQCLVAIHYNPYGKELLDILNKYSFDLDMYYKLLTKEIIDEVHAKGHIVNCWTLDEKEEAEKMVELGVDQITTNILE